MKVNTIKKNHEKILPPPIFINALKWVSVFLFLHGWRDRSMIGFEPACLIAKAVFLIGLIRVI